MKKKINIDKKNFWLTGFNMGKITQNGIDKIKKIIDEREDYFYIESKKEFTVCSYD